MSEQKQSQQQQPESPRKRNILQRYIRTDFKTLQGRITIGFLLVGLCALLMLLNSHFAWKKQLNRSNHVINITTYSVVESEKILQLVDLTNILSFRYLSSEDEQYVENIDNKWPETIMPITKELDSLSQYWETKDAKAYLKQINSLLPEIQKKQKELINTGEITELNNADYIDDMIQLSFLVKSLNDELNATEKELLEDIETAEKRIPWIISIEFFIAFIISTLVALFIIRTFLQRIKFLKIKIREMSAGNLPEKMAPVEDEMNSIIKALNELTYNLKGITHFAEEVGRGQFNTNITVFDNKGHLGESLAEMRSSLKSVAEADKRRVWFNEGVAKFGDILRQNHDSIKLLSEKLISELVKYLDANQGSIFIVNNEDKENIKLEMTGCYAFDRKKFVEKELSPGQGLAGQCYLEKEVIYLSEIPDSYVNIKSGLGESTPRYLIISPMKINDEVMGIIEIASFHPIEDYQQEFIDKVGENIASSIQALRVSIDTKSLLEESQMRAEQMQAQEEEMRQNMEEMEATQEELNRKNNEIERKAAETNSLINGLDSLMAVIEFSPDGIILKANDNFLEVMQATSSNVVGKHHRIFVTPEEQQSLEYQNFWNELGKGVTKKGVFSRVNLKGEKVTLNAIYTPIKDQTGQVQKIIKFAMVQN